MVHRFFTKAGCFFGLTFFTLATVANASSEVNLDIDPTEVIDRISITGDAENALIIPGSAQTLSTEEIERFGYGDIHRMLRAVPGVNILEEDGFGLFPNIGLRGTRLERNSRITAMEDGVLIAPAPYASPSAYYFPAVGRMSQIEVRKGSAAIQYGPYTTGGALNMLSTMVPRDFSAKADLMGGSHGGRRAHVWLGDLQPIEGSSHYFGYLLEGYHVSSDGFKRLDGGGDTGFSSDHAMTKFQWRNAQDPEAVDGHWYHELELKLAVNDRVADETYLGLTQDDFNDQPYRRYRGSALDEITTRHEQVQLRHFVVFDEGLDLTTTVYNNDFARNWYKLHAVQNTPAGRYVGTSAILADPQTYEQAFSWIVGEPSGDVLGNVRANNRTYYSRGVHSKLHWVWETKSGLEHALEVGLRYHRDQEDRLQWQDSYRMVNGSLVLVRRGDEQGLEGGVESGIPGSTTNRITQADVWSLSVYDIIRGDGWTLSPGFRVEDIDYARTDFIEGDAPSRQAVDRRRADTTRMFLPGMGATYRLSDDWLVLGGVHKGFAPTGLGSKEEKSWNTELGVRGRGSDWTATAIGFLTNYANLVGVCTASSGGGCEIGEEFDGGQVKVWGLELAAGFDVGQWAQLGIGMPIDMAYTYTQSKFQSSFVSDFAEWGDVQAGDELPQIPEHQVNLSAGFLWNAFEFNISANYVSKTRAVAGSGPILEDESMDARWLTDFSAQYAIHHQATLFASVENAFNETYLAARRPAGVRPGQPRTFWLGVKLRLD